MKIEELNMRTIQDCFNEINAYLYRFILNIIRVLFAVSDQFRHFSC